MLSPIRTDKFRVLWLVILLLVGQALFLQHQADLAQHSGNDHCEWCLTHAPLSGSLPGTGLTLPVVTGQVLPDSIEFVPFFRTISPRYAPRAPPAALSS
jgi:hypothetical protein